MHVCINKRRRSSRWSDRTRGVIHSQLACYRAKLLKKI
jgi:hypothetical protein